MGSARPSSEIVRFADFELDFRAGELRKRGTKRKLQERSAILAWIKVDPRLDPVRDDPRFHELLSRMKIPSRPLAGVN